MMSESYDQSQQQTHLNACVFDFLLCGECTWTEANSATLQYSACSAHAFKLRGLGVHIKLIKSVVDYGVLQTRHQRPVAGTPPHFQMAGRK